MNAVKIIIQEVKRASEIARELDISANMPYLWKRKYLEDKQEAFPDKGKLKTKELAMESLKEAINK